MKSEMKAMQYLKYGSPSVLKGVVLPMPTPQPNEVLIRVVATTVTATESAFRQGKPWLTRIFTGLFRPKLTILGEEFSGIVEAVGADVASYSQGDLVFGTAGPGFGANAEFLCLSEEAVMTKIPKNIDLLDAAGTVDGFLTALPFLRDVGRIKSGQSVLIYGASGSVGSAAVQIADYYGASVTGVCSGRNKKMVMNLGAKEVIDYTKKDFTEIEERFDIIFDAVGKVAFTECKHLLKPNGIFLESGIQFGSLLSMLFTHFLSRKKAKIAATGLRKPALRRQDLNLLCSLLESGRFRPVIDMVYPFNQLIVAHAYVDQGHKRGNVVVAFEREETELSESQEAVISVDLVTSSN